MNLSLWIFFIIPCLELIATVVLGEAIGFSRTAALLAILIIYLVAVHFLWCCPHCGHALGKPSSVHTHCPYCEKEL